MTSATLTTSVAASLQYVVSWHNFNIKITFPTKTATPGLSVYNRDTQTTTLVNSSAQYTTFAFWPDASQDIAIATQSGDIKLYVLETGRFSTITSVAFSDSATCRAVSTTISPFGNMIFVLTLDTGGLYKLVAINYDATNKTLSIVSTVDMFTQNTSSTQSLVTVSDGSSAFVTDSISKKLYIVSRGKSGYSLEGTSYDLAYLPRAMNCARTTPSLYIWMNQAPNSAFAAASRFRPACSRTSCCPIRSASRSTR